MYVAESATQAFIHYGYINTSLLWLHKYGGVAKGLTKNTNIIFLA
jgi:hypothetical protein